MGRAMGVQWACNGRAMGVQCTHVANRRTTDRSVGRLLGSFDRHVGQRRSHDVSLQASAQAVSVNRDCARLVAQSLGMFLPWCWQILAGRLRIAATAARTLDVGERSATRLSRALNAVAESLPTGAPAKARLSMSTNREKSLGMKPGEYRGHGMLLIPRCSSPRWPACSADG